MPSRVAPDLAGDGKPAGFQRSGSMARTLSVSSETHLLGPCSECEEANAEEEAVRPETGPELASCHAPPKTPCSRTVPKRGKQWTHDGGAGRMGGPEKLLFRVPGSRDYAFTPI